MGLKGVGVRVNLCHNSEASSVLWEVRVEREKGREGSERSLPARGWGPCGGKPEAAPQGQGGCGSF